MKSIRLAFFALSATVFAEPVDRSTLLEHAVRGAEQVWLAAQDPTKFNPRTNTFFLAALALCEAGVYPERLELLVNRMYGAQDRDPESPNYGSFRWNWNNAAVTDPNAIEFCMQPAAILWLNHRHSLAPAVREKLHAVLEPAAVVASLRHRVSDGYTNIALMSAGNLIALGEGLGRTDVADEGYQRLASLFALTRRSGIREYSSPDYYDVNLDAMQLAAAFAQRPGGRRQAQALVELLWTNVAANYWWPSSRLSGAHSRNYDYLYGTGGLDRHLWAAGWLTSSYNPGVSAVILALARYWPPAELEALSRRSLPRYVRQTWGNAKNQATGTPGAPERPATGGGKDWAVFTNWIGPDITLSVGGANYGPIDIPIAVDFPGPRNQVRGFFIPDGRSDPYGKSKIPWRGHPKAVHLQPFLAAAQDARDALALVVYRDPDIPAESSSLRSHFVLPRTVDAVFIGEQRVTFAPGRPQSFPVPPHETVFLRHGTAALAVHVPVARTISGASAPVELVWDDNEWGAIRLTVDHRLADGPRRENAAAAFQLRAGSQLDDAAFATFRRAFAPAEVEITASAIALRSAGANGRLAVAAEAPWSRPARLEPTQPTAVLEIDGQDVGAKILAAAQ